MFSTESLHGMSADERHRLLRELVDIERQSEPDIGSGWRWDAVLVVIVGCCVVLAAWIGVLAVTLPHFYRTGSWRGAWVGFDTGLFAAFAAVAWAAWRRRQLLIVALAVLATLLFCDAWFDVVLDARTAGFLPSLASALLVELPLAVLAAAMARRLLRITIGQIMRYEGLTGKVPPLWQIPLLGPGTGTPLRRLIDARARFRAASAAECRAAATRSDPPAG
ncbi:MAG TPA: hypothetical protein VN840_05570 [Streptosporangiaceae bacterium]|nr:hypothetical protein [Streptosporangiaceae bacterium]